MKARRVRKRTREDLRIRPVAGAASRFEVSREMTEEGMNSVLSRAYETSRSAPVVLLLRGLSPREIDRRMDALVGSHGIHVYGVEYRVAAT